MRILALISLSLLYILGAFSAQGQQCGSQAGGVVCPGGLCCSAYGYCGTTPAYCATGCQSNCNPGGGGSPTPTTPSPTPVTSGTSAGGQCGSQGGGTVCPGGLCCSEYGYCGSTPAYCTGGCQSNCGGSPTPTLPPPTPSSGGGGGGGQCGSQAGGIVCPGGLCCSQYGYCGSTPAYCADGCQSNCNTGGSGSPTPTIPSPTPSGGGSGSPAGGGGDISSLISKATFENMMMHMNDPLCPGRAFYTYEAFINIAKEFDGFGTAGDDATKKREIAAFLAQTSHETTGGEGWPAAPDGPYAWGYCFITEQNATSDYCDNDPDYPCAAGKTYIGRGPIQLSHNYNYGLAGIDIGENLLADPDLVATNLSISFKTAMWFWMTAQPPKPSCHNVTIGNWNPSPVDQSAGRVPGYGVITNIINGKECGIGPNSKQDDRIGFYKRYCDIMEVGYGNNLDCYNQTPWPQFNA